MQEASQSGKHHKRTHAAVGVWCRLATMMTLVATIGLTGHAGILARWSFDETSGTTAHDSAGTFDGTISPAGATFVPGGISGNAISLSKADNGFVNMGNVLALTQGDFSVVAWVKMSAGDTTECSAIVSRQVAGYANGYVLEANACSGYAQAGKAWLYDSSFHGQEVTSTTSVNDGNWHQIVGVYTAGGSKSIYVDGGPAQASNASRPIVGSNGAFVIGGADFSGTISGLFTGLIDEVQIYDRALTAADVDFLYRNPTQVALESFNPVTLPAGRINPVSVGHTNNGGTANGVAISGNYAYLANGSDGLRLYDISNPASPLNVGHTNDHASINLTIAYNVAISGNYAYLANYSDGVRVYDVSNPALPLNVARTNAGPWIRSLALYSHYVYLGGDSIIGVLDVINPASPVKVTQFNTFGHPNGMAVMTNEALLVVVSFSGMRVADISDPTNLVLRGQANIGTSAQGVAVAGHYAYVANGNDGLRVYEISNPTNILNVGHAYNGGIAYGVTLSGNHAFLANGPDGLRVYDISNPTNIINVGHVKDGGSAQSVAQSGNYAYLANGTDGLRVYALQPGLNINRAGPNTLLFSWPDISTGFILQQNPDLSPANWAAVPGTPAIVDGQNQLIISSPSANAFYRIFSP